MTSYYIDVKTCPICNCRFQTDILASSNTFNATFYTDGFIMGAADSTALVNCPGCNNFLWNEEVSTDQSFPETAFLQYPRAFSYGLDYERAKREEVWKNKDQEKYIRIRAWWSFNDAYRSYTDVWPKLLLQKHDLEIRVQASSKNETSNFVLPPEQEENLRYLLQILSTIDPDELIMKAEIYRELGLFDECLKELDQTFDLVYSHTIETIKSLAISGLRQVSKIE